MDVLSARDLCKQYGGQPVIRQLSLTLERGQCLGLLGPNGAGKTTTLRMLLGLVTPDAGSVSLLGHDILRDARAARAHVGVVPQMDNLDPDFSVRENLAVFGRYFGLSRRAVEARLPDLLELANLTHRADAPIASLSGGMKRRLTLARALINDPDLIFLDEPTTGLDPQARHMMWQGLRRLLVQGKTILLTTHFMEEAERLCDRVLIIDQGVAVGEDTPRGLIESQIEPHVVELYGDEAGDWAARCTGLCERTERAGETLFCYTHQPDPLMENLRHCGELRYLHRPANLEDVFLKLTGRELRD